MLFTSPAEIFVWKEGKWDGAKFGKIDLETCEADVKLRLGEDLRCHLLKIVLENLHLSPKPSR